ncbi:hypothetical protein MUP59_01035 [Candidatus Bathyarchaeota archaeon]|nr:hypothetical protein [Candidatus Bathyarchaeota archaeon]
MITPQLVKDFWSYMQGVFGSCVEQKNEAAVMKMAVALLSVLKIQNKDQFMKDFVTTLYNTIYIPFEIGINDDHWDLWDQICVCVHEHQHIVQGERDCWVTFVSRYLTSTSFRAGYEAEAYGCNLEMEFWRTGKIIDTGARVFSLKNYGCKDDDIEMAKRILDVRAEVVRQGVVENKSSITAIKWLDVHADSLREHP